MVPLTISAAVILILVFWPFIDGFGHGLLGIPLDGSMPRKTQPSSSVQPPPPTAVPAAFPSAGATPNQRANETYTLPYTDKRSPVTENEFVMDMQRAAQALNTHNDLGPLVTRRQWQFEASVLWSGVSMLQRQARSASPSQRRVYAKRAHDLAHLCHLVRTVPDDPTLQHYKVNLFYAAPTP